MSDSGSPLPDQADLLAAVRRLNVCVRVPDPIPLSESAVGPSTAAGVNLSAATAAQAAKILGVKRERIETVLAEPFLYCERKIPRYDVRLLFALKNDLPLPDAQEPSLSLAKERLRLLEGSDPLPAPPFAVNLYEWTTSAFRNPSRRIRKFQTRHAASEFLRFDAAERLESLSDEEILAGFTLTNTACFEEATPGQQAIGIEYGVRLNFSVPKVPRSRSAAKRRLALAECLYGMTDGPLPVFEAVVVITEKALTNDWISSDFCRQLEAYYEAEPAVAAWIGSYIPLWTAKHKSLEGHLPILVGQHLKMNSLRSFEAAAAAAVLFCDAEAISAELSKGPPIPPPGRHHSKADRRQPTETYMPPAYRSPLSEAEELEEIEAAKERLRHQHLARMGLAADWRPITVPNMYGADPGMWKAFCEGAGPVIPVGRKHGKTFEGIDVGALFGYDFKLDATNPLQSICRMENGMLLIGSWLGAKASLIMKTTVDIETGELLRPDGFVTTPEELFAGVRKLKPAEEPSSTDNTEEADDVA